MCTIPSLFGVVAIGDQAALPTILLILGFSSVPCGLQAARQNLSFSPIPAWKALIPTSLFSILFQAATDGMAGRVAHSSRSSCDEWPPGDLLLKSSIEDYAASANRGFTFTRFIRLACARS